MADENHPDLKTLDGGLEEPAPFKLTKREDRMAMPDERRELLILLNEAAELLRIAYYAHQKLGFEGEGNKGHSHEVRMFALHFSLAVGPSTPQQTILPGDGMYEAWRQRLKEALK